MSLNIQENSLHYYLDLIRTANQRPLAQNTNIKWIISTIFMHKNTSKIEP